ncbi:MAG: SUMF1/EgtB/PvdO family nonheme iron enzyme, partial [Planctomycetota bacterium]
MSMAQAVNLDWSTVGNPGNAPDQQWFSYGRPYGYGAVGQTFRIMTFEFTNSQYTTFLNTVDPAGSNPYAVYNPMMGQYGGIVNTGTVNGARYVTKANMDSLPIGTTWFSAARVANWLQNGQGAGGTETGAYTLNGAVSGTAPARNAGATYYVPDEDQWYKAAYYNGLSGTSAGYWLYPTQSNTAPSGVTVGATGDGSAGNSGNYANAGGGYWDYTSHGKVSNVGTNGGPSAYGAYDLGGNVREWADSVTGGSPGLLGGSFFTTVGALAASSHYGSSPSSYSGDYGFRLASRASAVDQVTSGTVTGSGVQPIAVSVASGGVIDSTAGNAAVGTLSGATLNTGAAGATVTTLTSGTVNTGGGGGITTEGGSFTGSITGNGGITKTGAGLLTLNTRNTYSGETVINGGTLQITVGDAIGSAPIRIANNGKFKAVAGVAVANTVIVTNTAATYEHVLGVSDTPANLAPVSNTVTTADVVAGDAGAATVSSNFNQNGSLSLHGLDGTRFLMVLEMQGAIPANATPGDCYLGWWDSSGAGAWVNAVLGNHGSDGTLAGAYTTSYQDFLTSHGGWNGTTMLGAYGLDLEHEQVWAVIDHNSDFGVASNGILLVPEPTTWAMALAAWVCMGWHLRCRGRAATRTQRLSGGRGRDEHRHDERHRHGAPDR